MQNVAYQLLIDGSPAPPELIAAVQQIEVEDHADLADMMRLRFAFGVAEDGGWWTLVDEDLFLRLTEIRLVATVGSSAETLMTGRVIRTSAAFSNRPGESVLDVVAMDPTVLMNLDEKVRPWPDMSDSEIATAILSESAYGLAPVVEETKVHRMLADYQVMQRGTDIQFLRHLARRNGFECYVEVNPESGDPEGHFHAPDPDQKAQGVLSVNLGESTNVNTFEASYDMIRPGGATAAALDIETRSEQTASVGEAQLTQLGEHSPLGGKHPRTVLLSQTGLSETAELQAVAQATVDHLAWAIRAEGELNTVAYGGILRAKRPIQVRGAGLQFSGTYYVERVLHTLTADGYEQRFSLRRNALGIPRTETFVDVGKRAQR
ncbi:phage late control D family protein [Candidatus Bipolaricaulota bacterium]